jgi:hypothetical protein
MSGCGTEDKRMVVIMRKLVVTVMRCFAPLSTARLHQYLKSRECQTKVVPARASILQATFDDSSGDREKTTPTLSTVN